MPSITLPIRGSSLRPQPETNDLIKYAIAHPLECQCDLEPDDDNEFDHNAVRILIDGKHVGFIPKERAIEVREYLELGQLTSATVGPAWSIRVNLRVRMKPASFPQLIDSTMLVAFRACPQLFFRQHCQNLALSAINPDLHAGACFAKGLDTTRKAFFVDHQPSAEAIVQGAMAFAAHWGDYDPPEKKENKSFSNCLDAFEQYFNQWPLETDPLHPLETDLVPTIEYSFAEKLPFLHPTTGDPLLYGGRMDMIARLGPDGPICIVDDKTGSYLTEKPWELRNQFLGYTFQLQQQGISCDQVLVRRILLYKRECKFAQDLVHIGPHMISRFVLARHRTILQMLHMWELFNLGYKAGEPEPWLAFAQDLGNSCEAYGGCEMNRLCSARDPVMFEQDYAHREWSPVAFQEELV